MNIEISKQDLQQVLSQTASIVDRRATMPVLANLLLKADKQNGMLVISATDLEVTAIVSNPAKVNSEGTTTVNAKLFSDIVKELPNDIVRIELTAGERLEINCAGSSMKLHGVSADEYPNLPGADLNAVGTIGTDQLLTMINKTLFAVSDDETSFNLTGVFLVSQESKLRMVATDGHRIAIIDRESSAVQSERGVIVPKKGLNEIKRFLQDTEAAQVSIGLEDGFFIISASNARYSVRLIEAEYPDYQQVIPQSKKTTVTVNIKELTQALRRVALVVTDKIKGIKLDFTADNSLTISGSSNEYGEATEQVEVAIEGEPVDIGFNANYLLDILATLSDVPELIIELNGALGPGKFYAENDPEFFSIVMPMRIG